MELIIFLIKMIAKAFDSPGARSPTAPNDAARQIDLARQIQQRIEEARARAAQEQQAQQQFQRGQQDPSGPMMARLPSPVVRSTKVPAATRKQTGRQPTALRAAVAKTVRRKAKRSAPPPLPSQVAMTATPAKATATETSAPMPAAGRRPAIPSADAKLLARWLRPQTLRSQYILTEVFQPPLALREQHLF